MRIQLFGHQISDIGWGQPPLFCISSVLMGSKTINVQAFPQVNVTHVDAGQAKAMGDLDEAIQAANGAYQGLLKTAKGVITMYAMTHNGECPLSVPVGVEQGFDYGLGCKFPDTCHCPKHPFTECATRARFSDPGIQTNAIISTFGYCRTGTWVYVASAIILLLLVASLIYFLAKRKWTEYSIERMEYKMQLISLKNHNIYIYRDNKNISQSIY